MSTRPTFSNEYFDPELKRLMPIEEVMQQNEGKLNECINLTGKRLQDVGELKEALKDAESILAVRERDTVRKIKEECQSLINLLRRREEELIEIVQNECTLQKDQLETATTQVEASEAELKECYDVLVDKERAPSDRLGAMFSSQQLMKQSSYFNVPQSSTFTVSSRPLVADTHLAVTKTDGVMHTPVALTIAMPESTIVREPDSGVTSQGLLHFIGTGGGTREYANPAESEAIEVMCNCGVAAGEMFSLVDPPLATPKEFRTKSQTNARIAIDFGTTRAVNVSSYVLQHGHASEHAALRSWKLLGSDDGIRWDVLDLRKNVRNNALRPYQRSLYECNQEVKVTDDEEQQSKMETTNGSSDAHPGPFFRYVAIEIDGQNAAGRNMHHIEVSNIELFGALKSTSTTAA